MFFRKSEPTIELIKLKKKEDLDTVQLDKKKIIITSFFAIVAILAVAEIKGAYFPNDEGVLGQADKITPASIQKPEIKTPRLDMMSEVGSRINVIKKNIEGLNAEEVATTSPQIQRVLRDIQGIKDLPANQAKEMCLKICSGI